MTSLNEAVWSNDKQKEREAIEGILEILAHNWIRHPYERCEVDSRAKDFVYLICKDKKEREHYLIGYKIMRRR